MAVTFAGLAGLGSLMSPMEARAGEWDIGASISAEVRYFPNDAQFTDQLDHWQPSLTVAPDIRWDSDDRKHQFVLLPFVRVDAKDDQRTHFDLREGYYRYNSDDDWSLTIGAAKVFWGTTESRHLVDIINQSDAVEDIDEEDKLGQPMINLTLNKSWGQIDFFVMSGFRDRTFPGVDGRLRFGAPVDTDNAIFTRDGRRAAPDFAARYSHYFGAVDIGLSVFHGTSREPRFAIGPGAASLMPVYDRISQGGVDIQYTKDAWLFKAEAIVREGQGDTFFASAAGVEYTLYQIFGTSADLGLLSEYLFDGRDEGFVVESFGVTTIAPLTIFDNDVFAGGRLALNDTQDSSVLAGATVDADDQTTAMFVEAQRRIGQNWTAEFEARLFLNVDPGNLANAFRDDDFLTLRLTRYF